MTGIVNISSRFTGAKQAGMLFPGDHSHDVRRFRLSAEGSLRPRVGVQPPPGGAVGDCPAVPPGGTRISSDQGFRAAASEVNP